MGKSSLIKAIHAHVAELPDAGRLILIEINREDIESLPRTASLPTPETSSRAMGTSSLSATTTIG
jgi:hypothetical protein